MFVCVGVSFCMCVYIVSSTGTNVTSCVCDDDDEEEEDVVFVVVCFTDRCIGFVLSSYEWGCLTTSKARLGEIRRSIG